MTIDNTIVEIQQVFKTVRESQIIMDLDLAQKDFVMETNYLDVTAQLSDLNINYAWKLPDNYYRFKEILLYDINGNPLYLSDFQLTYEIEFGNIYFKSLTATPISVIPTGIAYMYLAYYYKPTPLLAVADSFSVEDEHIEGVIAKVYAKYYSRFAVDIMISRGVTAGEIIHTRDFNAVKYWEGKAQEYRVKAKRWVNSKDYTGDGSAFNYGAAGNYDFTKRIDSNMTILTGLNSVYTKYAKFLITPTTVTLEGNILGFTSCTATLDAPNNTVTFAGDFSNLTWIDSNDKDFVITAASTTSISVQWSALSGQIEAIVYERN